MLKGRGGGGVIIVIVISILARDVLRGVRGGGVYQLRVKGLRVIPINAERTGRWAGHRSCWATAAHAKMASPYSSEMC